MAKTHYITPVGVAKYPHLVSPDTEGKFANGKYTTKLILTPDEAKPLIALLKAAQATHPMGKDAKLPVTKETIKDGETKKETGNLQFSMSSKFAPAIINPQNKTVKVGKLNEDFNIGAGSKIRVAGEVYAYDKGLSLQLHQVQVIDLVTTRPSMFDAMDGNFDQSEYEETGETGAFLEGESSDLGI